MKNNLHIKRIVRISLYVALAIALDYVKEMLVFLNMPYGGSFNIAVIPVLFASFHLGIKDGTLVGLLWYILSTLLGLNSPAINIASLFLDYVIPSCILGMAALFCEKTFSYIKAELGIAFVFVIRTLSILISGAYCWFPDGEVAGSAAAWTNSFAYNLPYCIGTAVIGLIIIPLLFRVFIKRIPELTQKAE